MKRFPAAILLLTLFVYPARGQAPKPPAPVAPITVKVKAPALAVLRGPTAGDVTWVYDERLLPASQVYADGGSKVLVFSAAGGTYHVVCVSHGAAGFAQQVYLVTFEGGPGPGPRPPDTLEARLGRAYAADQAAGKDKVRLKYLSEIYAKAGEFLRIPQTVSRAYEIIDFAVAQAVPAGELPATLREIDAYLQQAVPRSQDAPLTDALRTALRTAFDDVSRAVASLVGPRPPPPDPEVKPGARQVLLIRETAAGTPALARLVVALRVGVHAEWLKSRGHSLLILDDDAVGPDGQPTPALAKWRPHYAGLKLPAVVIADPAGNMLHAAPLLDNAAVDVVIEAIKKTGG